MSISDLASIATTIGVMIAVWQIGMSRAVARVAFEDSLSSEYRMLARNMSTSVFLGEDLNDEDLSNSLDEFYHYFDLCNSQVFLRKQGRISRKTWEFWCDGISGNMNRPAFRKAWEYIGARSGEDFSELRRIIRENYLTDPRQWKGDVNE